MLEFWWFWFMPDPVSVELNKHPDLQRNSAGDPGQNPNVPQTMLLQS